MVDLFVHSAGERDDPDGGADQVFFDQFPIIQARARNRRDDALFHFGAGPPGGELCELAEVERSRVDAALLEVDLEDLDALFVDG